MPNTAKGLYYPDSSTVISPIETVLANMQASVDTYLGSNATIHPIANVGARAALVALYPPTTSSPLFAWRADAVVGQYLEFTTDGTNWFAYNTSTTRALTTEDVDTLTDTGVYYQSSGASGTLARHYPIAGFAGVLTAFNNGGRYYQTAQAHPAIGTSVSGRFWTRSGGSALSWTPWFQYGATQVGTASMAAQTIASGAASTATAVTFPSAFATAPQVTMNINSNAAYTAFLTPRALNVTTTGFTSYLYNTGSASAVLSAAVTVGWVATI